MTIESRELVQIGESIGTSTAKPDYWRMIVSKTRRGEGLLAQNGVKVVDPKTPGNLPSVSAPCKGFRVGDEVEVVKCGAETNAGHLIKWQRCSHCPKGNVFNILK